MDPSKQERRQRPKLQPRPEPRAIKRRPSKQGSSKDRHGIVFADSNRTSTSTIRATTPDPKYPTELSGGSPVSEVSSQINHNGRTGYVGLARDHAGSVSNTDDENTIETRRRRSRPGAQDNPAADASPGSFIAKTRKRLGSITTSGAHSSKAEEKLTSIGFPSVVHSPAPQDITEDRITPRTPHRAFSPDSVSTYASGSFKSPNWLDPDSAKILQLMKTTCGRMHGILFFRPLHSNAWASGYCSILVSPGSLVCQTKTESAQIKTLIPDLRGCSVRTHYDSETRSTYLSVVLSSTGSGFQIRPSVPETFDSWLAALLCWQPLRPKGIHDKMTKPQPVSITEKRTAKQRRISDMGSQKGTAIIKVGKMLLWDGPLPSGSQTSANHKATALRAASGEHELWRSVSCTLHENGTFKLLGEDNTSPIAAIALSQLARCAVQRLDASVLHMPHCIAIYPQYTVQNSPMRQKRLMVVCLESRVVFEAWFVMLKALTVPELYGPEREAAIDQPTPAIDISVTDHQDMFRVERHLTVRLTEAKLVGNWAERETQDSAKTKRKSARALHMPADVYADVICGQDLRARTTIKPCSSSVFWADEFSFRDLAPSLNRVGVIVRMGNPDEQEWTMIAHGPYDMSGDAPYLSNVGGIEISSHDSVVGRVEVSIDELEEERSIEKWWPILDTSDRPVGQLLMRMSLQETVVLMSEEYEELSALLHHFANSLTTQMAQALGQDLRQLPGVLLDFYQASERVHDWLSSLIEEEIDGIYREQPPSRMRYSGRIQSTDSYENAEQREVLVRDLSRSATMEANLLFRGNSLVTKALDSHMKRLGSEYLESVLGSRLRKIAERDLECEVDPSRTRSPEQLERNWFTLLGLTNTIWRAIYDSATSCPMGLRLLFRHIRSCAEDRYGSFIRTVKYTSVSGFLFLRFFCPAILNPKLFGILSGLSSVHTYRRFAYSHRSSTRPSETYIHLDRKVTQRSCQHGQIRHERALDGVYEQIPRYRHTRVQEIHRRRL